MKRIISSLLLLLMVAGTANATTKKKSSPAKLVTAYSRTIPEAEQSNPPMEGHFFVVKWQDTKYPETFFWRGQGGWLTCNIERAHKAGKGYKTEQVTNGDIHKGDTLMLSPITGGRFPVPKEIPEKAKNTIFYKVNGSAWLSLPVKKINKQ